MASTIATNIVSEKINREIISGEVFSLDKPQVDLEVALVLENRVVQKTRTDSQGRYEFSNEYPAEYYLNPASHNFMPDHQLN